MILSLVYLMILEAALMVLDDPCIHPRSIPDRSQIDLDLILDRSRIDAWSSKFEGVKHELLKVRKMLDWCLDNAGLWCLNDGALMFEWFWIDDWASTWHRFDIDLTSTRHRFDNDLTSFWHRLDIVFFVLASFWYRFSIILASIWYRFGIELASF